MESPDITEDKENSGIYNVTTTILSLITKYRKDDKEKGCKAWIGRRIKDEKVYNDASKRHMDKMKAEVRDLYEERTSYKLKVEGWSMFCCNISNHG